MASSARLGHLTIGICTGDFTAQYGIPCKHMIYELLRIENHEGSEGRQIRKIVATRPLQLHEVCRYWRLPQALEEVDPLLAEEDPRVVARKGRPRNAPEEGIVPDRNVAVRRPRGQPSWHREPSSHEFIERAIQPSGQRAQRVEGRVARSMATQGFILANSQEDGSEGAESGAGRGRDTGRGRGRGRGRGGIGLIQPYENIIDLTS